MQQLRQSAIKGDIAAINDLIYNQLEGRGLLITVQKDEAGCLTVRLQGETVPDLAVYQDYIINGLQQLRPLDVQTIRVVGEAFDPAVTAEPPWEARVPMAKPRRSWRRQLQNPRPSGVSGQGSARPVSGRRSDEGRSRSQTIPQSYPSQSSQTPSSQTSSTPSSPGQSRPAPHRPAASRSGRSRRTVSQLVPAPSSPPGAWLPLWLEWLLVTGVLTLCWSLGINVLEGNVLMAAVVVYLQTCVVARRLPEARAWLTVSSLTTLLAIVLLPLSEPIPGVGPIQGIGQSWAFRRTAKEPLSWAILHVLLIVAAYIVSLEINSHRLPLVLVGYVLTSTGLVARCLGALPEQLPAPPIGFVAYGQAFLRRPWQSAKQAAVAPPTGTGSTTNTASSICVMVSETLGGLFIEQNLWAIWLLASAAITGLSLWLFISFIDHFAGLNLFVWFVIFAQLGLIVVPLVLYVLTVLLSSPPRAGGWQVPGLILFGISLLQLLVISSVISRGSG